MGRVENQRSEHSTNSTYGAYEGDPLPPIPVKRLDPDLPMPMRAHPDDAGADLYSAEDLVLEPGERALVATGIVPLEVVLAAEPESQRVPVDLAHRTVVRAECRENRGCRSRNEAICASFSARNSEQVM